MRPKGGGRKYSLVFQLIFLKEMSYLEEFTEKIQKNETHCSEKRCRKSDSESFLSLLGYNSIEIKPGGPNKIGE